MLCLCSKADEGENDHNKIKNQKSDFLAKAKKFISHYYVADFWICMGSRQLCMLNQCINTDYR